MVSNEKEREKLKSEDLILGVWDCGSVDCNRSYQYTITTVALNCSKLRKTHSDEFRKKIRARKILYSNWRRETSSCLSPSATLIGNLVCLNRRKSRIKRRSVEERTLGTEEYLNFFEMGAGARGLFHSLKYSLPIIPLTVHLISLLGPFFYFFILFCNSNFHLKISISWLITNINCMIFSQEFSKK